MLHPAVPEELRGTYLGMASDPVIEHLLSLGVTAVELMPVHHFVRDRVLLEQGLTQAQVLALRLLVDLSGELGLGPPSADTLVLLRLSVLSFDPPPRLLTVVDAPDEA